MTWNHDMGAAPRDRRILVSRPRRWYCQGRTEIAQWNHDHLAKKPTPYWCADEHSYGVLLDRANVPTRWMELPT